MALALFPSMALAIISGEPFVWLLPIALVIAICFTEIESFTIDRRNRVVTQWRAFGTYNFVCGKRWDFIFDQIEFFHLETKESPYTFIANRARLVVTKKNGEVLPLSKFYKQGVLEVMALALNAELKKNLSVDDHRPKLT
jgi:hypothetical protein